MGNLGLMFDTPPARRVRQVPLLKIDPCMGISAGANTPVRVGYRVLHLIPCPTGLVTKVKHSITYPGKGSK